MIATDKNGREIYISVYGRHGDDICIDEAYYTDSEEDVPDSVIDYIYDNYPQEIYEAWYEKSVGAAEYFEGER